MKVKLLLSIFNVVCSTLAGSIFTKMESELPTFRTSLDLHKDKIQGVNIGGWLLIEPWITPSLFDNANAKHGRMPIDEYTLCAQLGPECKSVLQNHWKTFFTESDFADIKQKYQLNVVRIPIGYWAYKLLADDPYVQGQDAYLDLAIRWCEKYDLKIMIDLHGLPGSQNGFDNSGKRGDVGFFKNEEYRQLASDVLGQITQKYLPRFENTILGIELANEPFGPAIEIADLTKYYDRGYAAVRAKDAKIPIFMHDAFLWDVGFLHKYVPSNGYRDVVYDFHHYVIFGEEFYNQDVQAKINTVCHWGNQANQQPNPVVVGEWSAAITDCAKYLNGVNTGILRFEAFHGEGGCSGKSDLSHYSAEQIAELTKYVEAQLDSYSFGNGAGWIFWNYKTETKAIEWDFKELVENGIFPKPPYTERKFPGQCTFETKAEKDLDEDGDADDEPEEADIDEEV